MKKSIVLIAMLLMGTVYTTAQEYVMFGIKGGVNFSSVTGDAFSDFEDESARTAFHLGLLAEIPISDRFSLQPEVLYSAQGYDVVRIEDGQDVERRFDYISVPVLAKFYLIDGFALEAGPQFSYLVENELGRGDDEIELSDDYLNKFDFSVGLGASWKLSNFFVYGRYNVGLTEIYDIEGADAKNGVIQLGVGLLF